ncbi:MAG TPA: T9SS type A sorting domain-containing protein [Chitinophagaceae bacterium]|nr:T9SS type A sorting domain-containing protein [Chitinophagaceae bacterium]
MKKILPVILIIALNIHRPANAQVAQQDSLALVDLYNSTNGRGWIFDNNWLTTQPLYRWRGITLDATGTRVQQIDLHDNSLTGSLPNSIGDLTELTVLNLPNNNLTGSIPSTIGNLKKLYLVKLWLNQLSGPIPSSIGNLTNLVYLFLNQNQFTGAIPSTIGNMTSLVDMELWSNKLSGSIPASIGNLSNLVWMNLYKNNLTGSIPSTIGNLSNLVYLNLYENQLSGSIPATLADPPRLGNINLSRNQLTGSLPPLLMKKVGLIDFSYNNLSGSLPAEINPEIKVLDLSNNQLTGAINPVGNLYQIAILNLSHNLFSQPIPSTLGNNTQMYRLDLSFNQLTDTLPASLNKLTGIRYFSIASNHLRGKLPSDIHQNNRGIDSTFIYVQDNNFTFGDLEYWANVFKNMAGAGVGDIYQYTPQAKIPVSYQGNKVFVSVGGAPNNNTYKWYNNSTLISNKIGDSTYIITSPGNYSVQVFNSLLNKLTLYSDTLFYTGAPSAIITYTGSTTVCDGANLLLSATSGAGLTYQWYKNSAIINNATGSSYNVTTSGNYNVVVSNPIGSATSTAVSVTVLAPISIPVISAAGSTTFCQGGSLVLTSSTANGNQWYKDGIAINNANAATLNVTSSGNYTTKIISGNCSSPFSNIITVTVNPGPSQPSIISGNSIVCENNSQAYFVPAVPGATSYTWILPAGWTGSSATTTITVTTGSSGGTISVKANNACGNSSAQILNVSINQAPTITSQGDTVLISAPASFYQWYYNNIVLVGETSRSLKIKKVGFYRVETSPDKSCWTASQDFPILVTTQALADTAGVTIYPNPAVGLFNVYVKLQRATSVVIYVTVLNGAGVPILQTNKLIFFGTEAKIPLTLTPGFYYIKVSVNGDVKTLPVIVQ